MFDHQISPAAFQAPPVRPAAGLFAPRTGVDCAKMRVTDRQRTALFSLKGSASEQPDLGRRSFVLLSVLISSASVIGGFGSESRAAEMTAQLKLPQPGSSELVYGLLNTKQPTEEELKAKAAEGFKSVLNLLPFDEAAENGLRDIATREEEIVTEAGMVYKYVPMPMKGPYTEEQKAQVLKEVQQLPRPCLIHCRSGKRFTQILQNPKEYMSIWVSGLTDRDLSGYPGSRCVVSSENIIRDSKVHS